MPYSILRTAKLKTMGNIGGSGMHNFRQRDVPNADPALTPENTTIGAQTSDELLSQVKERLETVPTVRKNAVLVVEYFIGTSPEWLAELGPEEREKQREAYFDAALVWLQNKHGKNNVVAFTRHNDETTPHACAYVVPIDEKGRLNAAGYLDGPWKLSKLQSDFSEQVGERWGLERGIEGSKAKHETLKRFHGRTQVQTPEVTVEIPVVPEATFADKLAEKAGIATAHSGAVEAARLARQQQNAQAMERRLAMEAKAKLYDIERAGKEAREREFARLKETAQEMRTLPLATVMEQFGGKRSATDKNNYETPAGRITVTGAKFFNHDLAKGSGGAIDLVMQLEDCDYKSAVAKLAHSFGANPVAAELAANASQQVAQAMKERPANTLYVQPAAVPERWEAVREYLIKARNLSSEIVDLLHHQKQLFADRFSNACFVLGFDQKTGVGRGVELRGTLEGSNYHGVRGRKSLFNLAAGKGSAEVRVALVESAIDAISLRQLGFEGRIVSTTGSGSMQQHGEGFTKIGRSLIAAFDADKAGDKMASELAKHAKVERLRPVGGKDWNLELKKKTRSAPAERIDLASRLQSELRRQVQPVEKKVLELG